MKYAAQSGIIDLEQVRQQIELKKRKELLDKHPHKIWEGNDGKWRTYINSEPNKRRLIKRKNREDLENIVIESVKAAESLTIRNLFEEYIERKAKNGNIKPSTVHRYRNAFNRHYVSTGWDRKDIKTVSAEEYADFIEDEIGRCSLDSKALSNLKVITTGILKRALKNHKTDYSSSVVYDYVDATPQKKVKDNAKEIITKEEMQAFIKYTVENQTVINLSLLLMLMSGLRVGEMVTLKFSDFLNDTSFRVERSETFYKNNDRWVYEVSKTKTAASQRIAYLSDDYAWIVEKLRTMNPFAEYLCTDENGERIRSYSLRNHLYGICRKLPEFNQVKSTHKLRKTFCSILLDAGFDNNLITSVMGHTDIKTSEQYYHYDRKSQKQKQDMVNNVVEFKMAVNS